MKTKNIYSGCGNNSTVLKIKKKRDIKLEASMVSYKLLITVIFKLLNHLNFFRF